MVSNATKPVPRRKHRSVRLAHRGPACRRPRGGRKEGGRPPGYSEAPHTRVAEGEEGVEERKERGREWGRRLVGAPLTTRARRQGMPARSLAKRLHAESPRRCLRGTSHGARHRRYSPDHVQASPPTRTAIARSTLHGKRTLFSVPRTHARMHPAKQTHTFLHHTHTRVMS